MNLFSFKESWKSHRKSLWLLACLTLLEGLSVLLGAWEVSSIVSGIFLEGMSMEKAAPHFGVLLFTVFLKGICLLRKKRICTDLAWEILLALRKKIHTSIWEGKAPPKLSPLRSAALEKADSLEDFFRVVLPWLLSLVLLPPLYFLAVLPIEPPTAILFLVTFPIAPLLLYLIGNVTKKASQRQWKEMLRLDTEFSEILQGLFTLKLFRREKARKKALGKLCRSFSDAALRVLQLAFVSAFGLELVTTLSIALIAVSIGLRLLPGYMEFSIAFFVLLLAPEFYRPLRQGGAGFHTFMTCRTAWEDIRTLLESSSGTILPRHKDKIQHPPSIQVSGLSFSYAEGQAPLLDHLSFFLPAGSFTLLAGTSGSGKSTLLKLLAGHLSPTQGSIRLGEIPLENIAPEDRPRHISYVPQEPHLFAASLRENVTLFQRAEEKSILAALEKVGLGRWLASLPQGLDTRLGNGGHALSNGQRHRLGLARAILQNTPVLLLDEVTAGLDEATEREIITFLKDFSYRRTILFASHRPAVLQEFPCIFRLDGGFS